MISPIGLSENAASNRGFLTCPFWQIAVLCAPLIVIGLCAVDPLFWTPIALVVVALAGVVVSERDQARLIAHGGTGLVCLIATVSVVVGLAGGSADESIVVPLGAPGLSVHLGLDALSRFFLFVVDLGVVPACLFGRGYERAHERGGETPSGPTAPFLPLFVAGMNLVVLADDGLTFLVGWEVMSITSWLLVLSEHREEGTIRAARVYMVMAAFGAACLIPAFALLAASAGDLAFAATRAAPPSTLVAGVVVVLVLLGAGSKAGAVPLHIWLPLAHPAAPAHVSALMSGVMTKVALYGLIRVFFDLAGSPAPWWGGVVTAVGAVTAVVGVLRAMTQDDVKRLLAYSTVENIGVILMGLGLALIFKAEGSSRVCALALSAALLHVLNHSLFKSLLFQGSGAIVVATGTRDLSRLGGLARVMPTTSVLTLFGCAAIAALPPFNGFVGEWLLFQAILNGPTLNSWVLKVEIALVAAAAALAAALAAACFVRCFGAAFLGRARSDRAREAREVGLSMRLGMMIPAVLCVVIGLVPMPVLRALDSVVWRLGGSDLFRDAALGAWFHVEPAAALGNSYNGALILAAVLIGAGLTMWVIHRFASNRTRRSVAWGCGHVEADPEGRFQHSASGLGQPIRRAMGATVLGAREVVDMPDPGDNRPATLAVTTRDPAWELLITPIVRAVEILTLRLNVLQGLSIRRHLTLMFAALVLLLVVSAGVW